MAEAERRSIAQETIVLLERGLQLSPQQAQRLQQLLAHLVQESRYDYAANLPDLVSLVREDRERGNDHKAQEGVPLEVREPPATYAEYRLLPEDAPRYEILEGVGYLAPSPGGRHQKISANLEFQLLQHVRAGGHGEVFDAPFDVVLSEIDVVQPDLLFIAAEHMEIVRDRGVFGAPDLVVEILSPSNSWRDLQEKLALYKRYGVREYWIVDVESRTVDVWRSRESALDTRRVVSGDGTIQSSVLPGLEVPLAEVFAGVERIRLD